MAYVGRACLARLGGGFACAAAICLATASLAAAELIPFNETCQVIFANGQSKCPDGSTAQMVSVQYPGGDVDVLNRCVRGQCQAPSQASASSCNAIYDQEVPRCPDWSRAQLETNTGQYFCEPTQCQSKTISAISTDEKSGTPPSPSSVATAIQTAATTAVTTIANIATSVQTSQEATVKAAADVSLVAANHEANAGLLLCAEGGNHELEKTGSGTEDIATCQGNFKRADELVKMAVKGGVGGELRPDERLLSDPAAVSTLEKFQSNFGVDKDEYVRRMLAAHGKQTELADMLSSKLTDEKLDKLFTAAAELEPTPETATSVVSGTEIKPGSKAKVDTSLRDSLRAKLEAASLRKPASVAGSKTDYSSIPAAHEKLQPAGLEPWINGDKEEQEAFLTIFDIMHQKLEEMRRRERI